jgi:beta-galactosidase
MPRKVEEFVRNGGTLVLGPRAATKDSDNRFYVEQPAPGPLRVLAGITISESTLIPAAKTKSPSAEYVPSSENTIISQTADWPGTFRATEWADVLAPHGARSLFAYGKDYIQGRPAVTVNHVGRGRVYYLGSVFDQEFYAMFAKRVSKDFALDSLATTPPGVEAVEREDGTDRLLFLLNFASEPRSAQLVRHWEDMLTGQDASDRVMIEPFGVRVLRQTTDAH